MQNDLHMIRLIICGDSFTGKSCIIKKFIRSDDTINTTIGVEFFTKNYQLNENELKLLIWDTAGGHKFRTIVNRYFRGSNGVILVFDVSSRDSFNSIKYWLEDINRLINNDYDIILIGNKTDKKQIISDKEIGDFIIKNNIKYFENSIFNCNVDNAFSYLINKIVLRLNFFKERKLTKKEKRETVCFLC